jgi:hypothetical protein
MLYLSIIKNRNKMELLNHMVNPVIEHDYMINHPTEGVMLYKEWIDSETGKCVDFVLRSRHGYDIDDAALVEEVQEFIDNN